MMSTLLEKKRVCMKLDDTIPLSCYIEGQDKKDSYVEYCIRVQRGPNEENSWKINHRYNDFDTLNKVLEVSGVTLPLPPKKVFGNMDNAFIAERQQGLQNYLTSLFQEPMFVKHECLKRFLDPKNYPPQMEDEAAEQVAMFFRSEPSWELVEILPDIGWRIRKHYFLTKNTTATQKNDRQILAWVNYGPDLVLSNDKDLPAAMKLLTNILHPYICPIRIATAHEKGAVVVRDFRVQGTLKDFICKAKPKQNQLKKYCYPKTPVSMNLEDIRRCGRQILEALKTLQDKGFPYGHLHTGNILMEGNVCRLLDIENSLLGIPSIHRHHLLELKKIQEIEQQDVYCFGHVLYEMTFGQELRSPTVDEIPPNCPPLLEPILTSILTPTACKGTLPTTGELLDLPFFSDIKLGPQEKMSLKIPSKLKEALKLAKETIEKRLKEDQKLLSQFRRYSKAQAKATSQEEKEKRRQQRKQLKKQDSAATDGSSSNHSKPARNSVSSAQASSRVPSAPPPPPASPSPPPATTSNSAPPPAKGRGALLSSITAFKKNGLKTARTKDRSEPKV